jgi:Flp pilus assembly protein TadG
MQTKRHSRASRRKGERGNVLAYTVLSALFLFLAVGLGVDLSHFYLAKTEMQNAADAAALAGASALTLPNPDRITTAVDRAVELLNTNKYNFNNKNFTVARDALCGTGQACVMFSDNLDGTYVSEAAARAEPDDIRFIRVTTPQKPVSVIFASPILGSALSLNAKATAGLSVPGNVRICIAPLSAVAPNPGESFPEGSEGTCPTPGIQKYTDGTADCDPTKEFCKGCTYIIRSGTTTDPSPGNYQILACAGKGGDAVRDALAAYGEGCKCGNVSPGDEIGIDTETKPGDTAGPVQDGLNVRFDDYKGAVKYSESAPPDLNVYDGITYSDYTKKTPFKPPIDGHVGQPDRRVLKIPIIEEREFDAGRDVVRVKSLSGFFMQEPVGKKKNGDIKVEYVGGDVSGVTGLDPSGGTSTNIVTPVLYR